MYLIIDNFFDFIYFNKNKPDDSLTKLKLLLFYLILLLNSYTI